MPSASRCFCDDSLRQVSCSKGFGLMLLSSSPARGRRLFSFRTSATSVSGSKFAVISTVNSGISLFTTCSSGKHSIRPPSFTKTCLMQELVHFLTHKRGLLTHESFAQVADHCAHTILSDSIRAQVQPGTRLEERNLEHCQDR